MSDIDSDSEYGFFKMSKKGKENLEKQMRDHNKTLQQEFEEVTVKKYLDYDKYTAYNAMIETADQLAAEREKNKRLEEFYHEVAQADISEGCNADFSHRVFVALRKYQDNYK